jgi:hypothetical protein
MLPFLGLPYSKAFYVYEYPLSRERVVSQQLVAQTFIYYLRYTINSAQRAQTDSN